MSPLRQITLQVGALAVNCYILACGGDCAVIDPGTDDHRIAEVVASMKCGLRYILLTHGHFDHIGGVEALKTEYPLAPVIINAGDADMITSSRYNYSLSTGAPFALRPADRALIEGDRLPFGDTEIVMLHTPGHSPGSCCYRIGDDLYCGDTIFCGDVGRTDLHGGSEADLNASLARLALLPDRIRLHPGHGPETNIGRERGCEQA